MKKAEKAYCEKIKQAIDTNDNAVKKAILIIYQNQTADEQVSENTIEHNGVGFTGVDAEFLSSIAVRIQRGLPLSEKQIIVGRRKIRKYSRQLLDEAKRNGKYQED